MYDVFSGFVTLAMYVVAITAVVKGIRMMFGR